MSIKAMKSVWQYSQQQGSRRLILLALAYFADESGHNCYPSVRTLAQMVNLSTRQVQSHLAALQKSGEIKIGRRKGYGRSNQYDLSPLMKDDADFMVPEQKKVKPSAKRVKSSAVKGEEGFTRSENDPLIDPKDKREAASKSSQINFPSHLDTQEFRYMWIRWEQHRRELGAPLSSTMRDELLSEATKHTAEDVCWLISLSIQNGWKGLFWERLNKRKNTANIPQSGSSSGIVANKFGL